MQSYGSFLVDYDMIFEPIDMSPGVPVLTVEPSVVKYMEMATLTCSLEGDAQVITWQWYQNGQLTPTEGTQTISGMTRLSLRKQHSA